MKFKAAMKHYIFKRGTSELCYLLTLKVRKVRSFSPAQSAPRREAMNSETAVISGVNPSALYSLVTKLDINDQKPSATVTKSMSTFFTLKKFFMVYLLPDCVAQSIHDGFALLVLSHCQHVLNHEAGGVRQQSKGVDSSVNLKSTIVKGPENFQNGAGAL